MSVLLWIVLGGVLMSALALIGGVTVFLTERQLGRVLLPLVALAAGSLLGGAFFHMIPAASRQMDGFSSMFLWVVVGFALFLALEQFLHWHHCHRTDATCREPLGYLILLGDALHNFIGGLAVAGAFIVDIRVGITAWLAAAAHEVPQEVGDFGVLVHAGWSRRMALLFNVASASTFLLGGLVAYFASATLDVTFLLPLAAGNFIYIAASDLVPEVNKQRTLARGALHFGCFLAGLAVLYLLAPRAGG
jgi:zinc and cadmium transporter